jgi:class 3 adenylate cyclase
MPLRADLESSVDQIIKTAWAERDGRVVPESDDSVKFIHDAVTLDATFLYADLADSTTLAQRDKFIAAEVFQAFLNSTSRVMLSERGEIRSFDGDRVMAVFIGDDKNSRAARCALKINWAFSNIVKPKLEAAYATKFGGYALNYAAGIDTGKIWAVRGGVRNNSDLVWVGRAPNLAAKLSAMREGVNRTWITGAVYERLEKASKYSNGVDMWTPRTWTQQGKMRVYCSGYSWTIP